MQKEIYMSFKVSKILIKAVKQFKKIEINLWISIANHDESHFLLKV